MVGIKLSRIKARKLVSDYIGRNLWTDQMMTSLYPEYKYCFTMHEVVHHINGNPSDNRNENLLVCSASYHHWLHEEMKRREFYE